MPDNKIIKPYMQWESPITEEWIARGGRKISALQCLNDKVFWLETVQDENNRTTIMSCSLHENDEKSEIAAPYSIRSRVHEYGGGAYKVHESGIYFVNDEDQNIYILKNSQSVEQLTYSSNNMRYADFEIDTLRDRLLCICEDHSGEGQYPVNAIISIGLKTKDVKIITSGADFYSDPRLSSDGQKLAWISWNKPHMPWDNTELWLGSLDASSNLEKEQLICGESDHHVAAMQPQWAPNGDLYFIADKESDWWNLYKYNHDGVFSVYSTAIEFGMPPWNFGFKTYGFGPHKDEIYAFVQSQSEWQLIKINTSHKKAIRLAIEFVYFGEQLFVTSSDQLIFIGHKEKEAARIVAFDFSRNEEYIITRVLEEDFPEDLISIPEIMEIPTTNGESVFGFYYAPQNNKFMDSENHKPPLIVKCHGGPTSATSKGLSLKIQYWTSRGFAVFDLNYRGSTGYGRKYRESLYGFWGQKDVEDCVSVANFLSEKGYVNRNHLAISGGSAGGYLVLCAMAFHDVFSAATSYYGISDVKVIALETHKFESGYNDKLIAPYSKKTEDIYNQRSPLFYADQIKNPILFFQGDQDKVVPPNQSEMLVNAMKKNNIDAPYHLFEGEGHGFRKPETIAFCLSTELAFYQEYFRA